MPFFLRHDLQGSERDSIVYNSTSFAIDNRNNEEITKRANKRLASQEIIKQQNRHVPQCRTKNLT